MSLVSLSVNDIIRYDWHAQAFVTTDGFRPKKENTYMFVFGPDQERHYSFFQNIMAKDYNILYEAPRAFNKRYNTGPRNTLIIFETKDE